MTLQANSDAALRGDPAATNGTAYRARDESRSSTAGGHPAGEADA